MSLAKLTSLSTQTLSLLLERQRLQTLPSFSADSNGAKPSSLHLPQITRNLERLRSGILELEEKEGQTEADILLRSQFERMRGMLGGDSVRIERYSCSASVRSVVTQPFSFLHSLEKNEPPLVSLPTLPAPVHPPTLPVQDPEPLYSPYTDDPEANLGEPGIMLQTQRRMIDGSSFLLI